MAVITPTKNVILLSSAKQFSDLINFRKKEAKSVISPFALRIPPVNTWLIYKIKI
jgi:hypothetical protein